MTETYIPGGLKKFKVILKNADGTRERNISNLVLNISITEDIFKNTLYGALRIKDAVDLLGGLANISNAKDTGFPIIGEEFLEIDYATETTDGNLAEVSLRFAVYAIENINYAQNNTLKEYTLNFCSEEHLIDATGVVMKSYNRAHSDNIDDLTKDYLLIDKANNPFKGKRVKTLNKKQETKGLQNVVIPRLTPLQACQFLARRSISSSDEFVSATYLFFENFKGFNFCDVEYLIKKGMEKIKSAGGLPSTDNKPHPFKYVFENPLIGTQKEAINPRETNTILKMQQKSFFDTVAKLKRGMFESDVIVYDYINQKAIPSRFRFLDNGDKTNNKSLTLGNEKEQSYPENSITFMNSVTSKDDKEVKYSRFFFIPKDLSSTNQDSFMDQIYPARASYFTRLAQNMFTLDVYGNPKINAGDVVFITMPAGNPQDPSALNPYLTGYYLVATINHILTQTTYQAKWDVYKNSFGKKVESTPEAASTKTKPTDNKSKQDNYQEENDPGNLFPNVPDNGVVGTISNVLRGLL